MLKTADHEALKLLNWLASSQAAEDINSDDDLARETILSPLLPASDMAKMLERANIDYESQSQKECQDILDCVEDLIDIVASKKKAPQPIVSCQMSLKKNIPWTSGSSEDQVLISCAAKSYETKMNSESEKSLQAHTPVDFGSSFTTIQKRKRPLQRSKSFSMYQKVKGDIQPEIASESVHLNCFGENDELKRCRKVATGCVENDSEFSEESSVDIGFSMRDLMRRKRCYRVELPECDKLLENEKVLPTDDAVCSSRPCTLQTENVVFDNHGHFSSCHSTNPLQKESEVSAENPKELELTIAHIHTHCSGSGQHGRNPYVESDN